METCSSGGQVVLIAGDDERVVDSSVLAAERASTMDYGNTSAAETTESTPATETTQGASNTESVSTNEETLVEKLLNAGAPLTDQMLFRMETL